MALIIGMKFVDLGWFFKVIDLFTHVYKVKIMEKALKFILASLHDCVQF
jgi:hypothetical protein